MTVYYVALSGSEEHPVINHFDISEEKHIFIVNGIIKTINNLISLWSRTCHQVSYKNLLVVRMFRFLELGIGDKGPETAHTASDCYRTE